MRKLQNSFNITKNALLVNWKFSEEELNILTTFILHISVYFQYHPIKLFVYSAMRLSLKSNNHYEIKNGKLTPKVHPLQPSANYRYIPYSPINKPN